MELIEAKGREDRGNAKRFKERAELSPEAFCEEKRRRFMERASKPFSSDEIVRRIAKVACERICQRLIRAYRQMPAHLFGDDSPLANLWEDICIQAQEERSVFWGETYEASLLGFLEGEVDDLDETTRWAIWHQTDGGIDWCVDDSEPPENWSTEELARFILDRYVLPAAEGYSNASIRRYFERWEGRD
jgi:hypothetical protein